MLVEEINNGGYHYLSRHELEQLLDDLEDAITNVKRELRDRNKYE